MRITAAVTAGEPGATHTIDPADDHDVLRPDEIDRAAHDAEAGRVIKPVLRMGKAA